MSLQEEIKNLLPRVIEELGVSEVISEMTRLELMVSYMSTDEKEVKDALVIVIDYYSTREQFKAFCQDVGIDYDQG